MVGSLLEVMGEKDRDGNFLEIDGCESESSGFHTGSSESMIGSNSSYVLPPFPIYIFGRI